MESNVRPISREHAVENGRKIEVAQQTDPVTAQFLPNRHSRFQQAVIVSCVACNNQLDV
jgi:hypothetical protein